MNQDNPPTPSATLMLVHGSKADFEVLLVERNKEIEFAGGAYVFPGGKITEPDTEYAENAEVLSAKIAAIRETFEEIGILLALSSMGEPIFEKHKADLELRIEIEKNPARFTAFLSENNYSLLSDNLTAYAIWVTPKQYKRRFATWFFIAELPRKFEPLIDGNEAVSALWLRPHDALSDSENGNKIILFPTICNLKMLDIYRDFEEIEIAANSRTTPIIEPIPKLINGKWEITIGPNFGYQID